MNAWLAIDTATDLASVALHDGAAVLAEHTWTSRRKHTVELAPAIQRLLQRECLEPTSLGGIAVAIGPGSYTGLRVGLSLAKGLALAAGLPVVGVPTLHALAAPLSRPYAARDLPLWAVLRAGRGRVVAACYPPTRDSWPEPDSLTVWTVTQLTNHAEPPAWVVGELDDAARAQLTAVGLTVLPAAAGLRRAGWLAEVGLARYAAGRRDDPATLVPVYSGPGPGTGTGRAEGT